MHALLIEDDPMIGQSLSLALNEAGLTVDWVMDGTQGLEAALTGDYTVVLLDLGLPSISGFKVLELMRTNRKLTPLLIITARDEVDDLVEGLDLGADDYLVKPFSFKELLARLHAVLRRNNHSSSSHISNGEIILNMETHEAIYRSKTMMLTSREFSLMQVLLENPGRILSKNQIEERIYGWNEEVEGNAVEVLIHYLRKKFDREIIRNVRGIGWMVVKHPE